ncbi:MAG: hypothetical protein IJL21_04065 [Alphaproteobacteria bacterium]|nr:hypothetical protein [Alphaproteobacteria bacterium]
MKRLAIFIGGLLVMPAFAEVAPVFIDENDAIEYADGMYDENGFFVAPEEIVETETEADTQKVQTPVKISRAPVNATPVANRTTTTRAMPASAGATTASGRGSANGNSSRVVAARTTTATPRATASRTVASRGTTATSPRAGATSTRTATSTAATRAAAARTTGGATRATSAATGATVARTATSTGRTTAARTATATTARAATASGRLSVDPNRNVGTALKNATITAANGTVTLNDSGGTLYNKSASIRRTPTIRMSSLNGISAETTAVSTMSLEDMDDLAELTDYCKAQYANCMDNYCNVLDDNQGRCSCSANLKNYARAEAALKTATEELQDVAQKIQYIGLTTREVETLFTETIAEETMRTKGTDTSQLQASLNKIKDMIIDVKSGTATSSASNDILGLNFDLSGLLEFSFDSTGFDLGSLFGTTNTNSVSNQRGEELYKTAAARCKSSVLKACTARGVDASLVTNAYDLEIDRECMAYERSLNDSNDQMLATVRNAKNVLQKARLMVAQQKNAYDMRGCINALDACMQDEFVCGSDYENCLDPTGRYIVNGEIVVGSQPGHAIDPESQSRVASVMTSDVCRVNLYRTWDMPGETCRAHSGSPAANYESYPTDYQGNAWGSGTEDTLSKYIEKTVIGNYPAKTSENMSLYLQNKIGYNQKDRNYGMCMSVLNKCQDYTYTRGTGTSAQYEPANQVVQQYLARVLVQIKAKQDEILANYAETCVSDVTSCLGQNGYPTEDPSEWDYSSTYGYSTYTTKMNIAVNACRAQIVTCMSVNGYSIETPTPTEMNCWVQGLLYSTSTDKCMPNNLKQDCADGQKLCNGECIDESEICEQPVQQYYVSLECGNGCNGSKTVNGTFDQGSSVTVPSCGTIQKPNVTWTCSVPSGLSISGGATITVTNKITCSATCDSNPTPPTPQEYVVNINCGSNGQFVSKTGTTPGGNDCSSTQCGTVTFTDDCINLNEYCSIDGGEQQYQWNCADSIILGNNIQTQYCPAAASTSCVLTWKGGHGSSNPEWVTVNFNYGTATGVTPANPSKLYVDATHQACYDAYDTTATVGGEKCPANIVYNITVPSATGVVFDGFYNGKTEYINENGVIQNAFYNIDGNITLTAHWKSPAAGGMRYVQIEDNGGARTKQTRGNSWELKTVWIDTDGSTCQYPGVYIADPNTNMVVCTSPVDTIGWWVKPGSRSSGFYIDVNGEKVLFAREWGEIVTENISKFAATDPDTTLVATPTVYDTNVGYVSFDEENKTWTDTYSTSQVDQYAYLHNKFNIDFYPNRPTSSGSLLPLSYTYIEGDGYYKQPVGMKVTAAPVFEENETGYTFRGFYPGPLPAVSSNSSTGMVWPATTGGMSPVPLLNTKWVLVTDNPDFQTLNLYAAWAKNCPSPLPAGMKKCNLTIGTNGSVTYAVECQDGYEIQGAGADAKCIIPGSNWRSVIFDGATVAY